MPAAAVIRRSKRYPDLLGLKGAQADLSVSGEIPGLNSGTAIDTVGLEFG